MAVEWLRVPGLPGPEWEGALDRAVEVLSGGGTVAFATDTFYALGADPLNAAAVARVFRAKSRDPSLPVPLLVSGMGAAREVAAEQFPGALEPLLERFWPGALTVVVPARFGLPDGVRGADGRVGLRWPDWPIARALLERFGRAITGTSANRSGRLEPASGEEICGALGDEVDLVLDSGCTPGGPGSTVIGLIPGEGGRPRLEWIRDGRIPWEDLQALVGGTPGGLAGQEPDSPQRSGQAAD